METPPRQTAISDQEAASFYRVAMHGVADYAVFLMDPEGFILDWNPAAEAMKGYTAAEAKGRFFGILYTDGQQAEGRPRRNLEEAARKGTFQEETWRKKKDGSPFWAHVELIAVYGQAGGIRGYCKLTQDLTARKAMEDRLRQTREETEQILELARAATWQWNSGSGEVSISPASTAFPSPGEGKREVPGDGWAALVHPEDLPALQKVLAAAVAGPGGISPVEFRLRQGDGAYRWFYTHPRPPRQPRDSDSPVVVSGVMLDIQERKDAEKEKEELAGQVAAERARALAILEQMPVAVVLADIPSGAVFHYNGEARRLFEAELRHIDDEAFRECELLQPDGSFIPFKGSPLSQAVSRGETVKELELHCRQGEKERYFSVSAIPTCDSDGIARVAVAIFTDVTIQKEAEAAALRLNADLERRVAERTRELVRANDVLLASNQELQRFAYIASHDLQTPLRTIIGFSQILQQQYAGQLDGRANGYIDRVVAATYRLHALIRDLLTYSRLNAQARPFEPVDFRDIFQSVVAALAGPIGETGAEVTHGDLPQVLGDRGQLTLLLQNLVDNGIKYHGPAPPKIHAWAEAREGEWLFSVRDNGIGMDARHVEAIFEVFRRLHTQQAYPGTGIGLPLCRRVVERHGGRIWAESEPGKGSVFRFTLPAGKAS